MKYSEKLFDFLKEEHGYTHCFFLAGGNTMHLLDAARTRFECIPVVHEVAAGIAAEYFNETNPQGNKAFALVTAGPGLTNIVTALAGAFLESRELLVIGGQVKTSDLKDTDMRQRGIQEVDGRAIVEPITRHSVLFDTAKSLEEVDSYLENTEKPGPIFFEIPLDIQGSLVAESKTEIHAQLSRTKVDKEAESLFLQEIQNSLSSAKRPVILLGGGIHREKALNLGSKLSELGVPIMTTWNGTELYGSDMPNYWGRPNTWGQRAANMLLQQSDLLIAIGTRLGLQQTGFAWEEFCPLAEIYQVDIDSYELTKGHPRIKKGLQSDADSFLQSLVSVKLLGSKRYTDWLEFGGKVLDEFPLSESANTNLPQYVDPFSFVERLSGKLSSNDAIVPCSSGGAFTVTMQAFRTKQGQTFTTNKGLASMGYGLSGAIGAAISTDRRTILIEGDGGFSQNFQELGTVARQNLNLKMFVFSNSGYASIRMTQKNYFNGAYLGCDTETGLGMPEWDLIAQAYGLEFTRIDGSSSLDSVLDAVLNNSKPQLIEVAIDPEQTYWPKISSRILENGAMASNPLHLMTPDLSSDQIREFLPFLADRILR